MCVLHVGAMRVLILEDHLEVADLIARALEKDGHTVKWAGSIADADSLLGKGALDLAVVDIGLPDGDGVAWCARIRAAGHTMPVLILTAQRGVHRRVAGLDSGADDFLAKPFAVAELRARVRALGRRAPLAKPSTYRTGAVVLDFGRRTASVRGHEVPLTAREWEVTEILAGAKGCVVSRADILFGAWGEAEPTEASAASLEVLVVRIRKKLGAGTIRTLRGSGGGYALG